jgi:hypothetical protein
MAAVQFRKPDDDEWHLFREVLEQYHGELDGYVIEFIFRDKPQVLNGRNAAATANKVNTAVQFLSGMDGYVAVCERSWDGQGEAWQRYLIDHELSHFSVNDKGFLELIGHDIEDFRDVLARHDPGITGMRHLIETAVKSDGYGED